MTRREKIKVLRLLDEGIVYDELRALWAVVDAAEPWAESPPQGEKLTSEEFELLAALDAYHGGQDE